MGMDFDKYRVVRVISEQEFPLNTPNIESNELSRNTRMIIWNPHMDAWLAKSGFGDCQYRIIYEIDLMELVERFPQAFGANASSTWDVSQVNEQEKQKNFIKYIDQQSQQEVVIPYDESWNDMFQEHKYLLVETEVIGGVRAAFQPEEFKAVKQLISQYSKGQTEEASIFLFDKDSVGELSVLCSEKESFEKHLMGQDDHQTYWHLNW